MVNLVRPEVIKATSFSTYAQKLKIEIIKIMSAKEKDDETGCVNSDALYFDLKIYMVDY